MQDANDQTAGAPISGETRVLLAFEVGAAIVRFKLDSMGVERVVHLDQAAHPAVLTPLAPLQADGLVELPEDLARLEPGTVVDFLPFNEVSR